MDDVNWSLRGCDAAPDPELLMGAEGGRVRRNTSAQGGDSKLGVRDLYIARLTGDRGPDDDEGDGQEDHERESDDSTQDSDRLEGRAGYLVRLEGLCDEYSRQYERSQSARRMNRR